MRSHQDKFGICQVRSLPSSEFGILNSELNTKTSSSALRTPNSALRRGQASLELAVALVCSLILLFGCVKVFVWLTTRLVTRQQQYEHTRVRAAKSEVLVPWQEENLPPLDILDEQRH